MANYAQSTRDTISDIYYGLRADASPATIATGQNHIFRIGGGRVFVNDYMGVVTTAIQAAATLLHWDFDADFGGDLAMCVDSADLTGDLPGTIYLAPAAVGGALTVPAAGAFQRLYPAIGFVFSAGYLDLHASAARTGVIHWSFWYVPLDTGAYIEAV
jgi:hypothetical protein